MELFIHESPNIYEKECGNIMNEYMSDLLRNIKLNCWYIMKNIPCL